MKITPEQVQQIATRVTGSAGTLKNSSGRTYWEFGAHKLEQFAAAILAQQGEQLESTTADYNLMRSQRDEWRTRWSECAVATEVPIDRNVERCVLRGSEGFDLCVGSCAKAGRCNEAPAALDMSISAPKIDTSRECVEAAKVLAGEQDLLDIVRTFCHIAQRMTELTASQRENYPSPLSACSPVLMAAQSACVERGYTEWGLAIEGVTYPAAPLAPTAAAERWISVEDRLPPVDETVMVFSPPTAHDWPGEVNIRFDYINPDCDEPTSWQGHNANYEHYCCVAGSDSIGPLEKAPYTHWMPLPAAPNGKQGGA